MKRWMALAALGCALAVTHGARAEEAPGASADGAGDEGDAWQVAATSNELSLNLAGSSSPIAGRQAVVGVRYGHAEGDWAMGLEPRAGFGITDGGVVTTTATSVGLDATIERRFPVGRVTFVVGGGAGAEYVWRHVAETSDAAEATDGRAFAAGPIAVAGVRIALWKDSWVQVGLRGGVELACGDAPAGAVGTFAGGWSGGVAF